MSLFRRNSDAAALEDLLDRERALILDGDFPGLRYLQREKDRFLDHGLTQESVFHRKETLQSKIKRNQNLLLAASAGVKSIAEILKNDQGKSSLKTYGKDGRTQDHSGQPKSFERRA